MDEDHPIQPLDFNGIHKYAATAYHQVLTAAGRLDAVVLCLTNVYGPRMALNLPAQGFMGGFLRKAMLGKPITVFGDGRQLRDPVYVDDAVDAFLLAGAVTETAEPPVERRRRPGIAAFGDRQSRFPLRPVRRRPCSSRFPPN